MTIDALYECQDKGIAEFLKLIIRTRLNHPSKIKWLLTSRPLDSAERELLARSDQTYITARAAELDRRQSYGPALRLKVEAKLTKKAEDTFLWVSLVCKRLKSVCRAKVLTTI